MSQKSVEIVIGRLATDEGLRARYSRDPGSTLRALREGGLELNTIEVAALLEMSADQLAALASSIHPKLQKIDFKGDGYEP